ncbi:MAG TPA: PaaI family thioesterase [Xanthobacteraceae bacterium]|nr:PaaI family thioesterase [Xanthobacteraceae bacterium]
MSQPPFPAVAAAIRRTLEGQGFTRLVGAEVVSVDPGVVVMGLDRRDEVLQQNGLFHGGVIAYPIDNAATAAAATVIDRSKRTVITAEYKVNLVAPSKGDRLTCRAEVVKAGRSLTVVDARVHCRTDGEDRLVAVALATIANLDLKAA